MSSATPSALASLASLSPWRGRIKSVLKKMDTGGPWLVDLEPAVQVARIGILNATRPSDARPPALIARRC